MSMSEKNATLHMGEKAYTIPVLEGAAGDRSLDIRTLRKDTRFTAYDPGFVNTASCKSAITYLDGEAGILRYRGYAIEGLVEHCSFIQVAYLLVHGALPTHEERDRFGELLNRHSMIHEDMRNFFRNFPEHAHPMSVLSAMVVSMSAFYPELDDTGNEETDMTVTRLLSKMRTIAAFSYKKSIGEPFVYPSHRFSYCDNFLNMMFSSPVKNYQPNPVVSRALNKLLILHADHEQNCSTSAVRLVGSSFANLYAAITAGICALWGPRHGGANQEVIEMLTQIRDAGGDVNNTIERIKDKTSTFRLMGFGHRVYKTYDPRAKVAKRLCEEVLNALGIHDELLDIAMKLEERALSDDYFITRNLYPNVDFYTGIIFRAIGIPTNMFTVMFAIGRTPGWIANWLEMRADPTMRIGRPRQLYVGPELRKVPSFIKEE
ncbi:MAG: citrate synthase [Kiritimatiellae bacterium]|nr:citrate synthase [Kiritimatiellia bacterium]